MNTVSALVNLWVLEQKFLRLGSTLEMVDFPVDPETDSDSTLHCEFPQPITEDQSVLIKV